MIKYRYHTDDPEPPEHVRRVQVLWEPYTYEIADGVMHTTIGGLGDKWTRTRCNLKSGGFVYGRWPHLRIGRSHRSITKKQWRRERSFPRQLCRGGDHAHWYNGDRHRAWGRFRGHVGQVLDLDAYRRMHTTYRRRH